MIELLPTLTSAISTLEKIKAITDKRKFAELQDFIGDLSLQLAQMKIGMAGLLDENHELKRKLQAIENSELDPCPRCKQRTYRLEESAADPVYGFMGARRHTYKCGNCDYTDVKSDGLY